MTDEARRSQRMPHTPWWRRLLRWEVFLGRVIAADFALNVHLSPYFLSTETFADVSFNFTEKALVALPMALLIIAGEIDISVTMQLPVTDYRYISGRIRPDRIIKLMSRGQS